MGEKITRIFNLGIRWSWAVSFTLRPLYACWRGPHTFRYMFATIYGL